MACPHCNMFLLRSCACLICIPQKFGPVPFPFLTLHSIPGWQRGTTMPMPSSWSLYIPLLPNRIVGSALTSCHQQPHSTVLPQTHIPNTSVTPGSHVLQIFFSASSGLIPLMLMKVFRMLLPSCIMQSSGMVIADVKIVGNSS